MANHTFLSFLQTVDWGAALQWYLIHLDASQLLQAWAEGRAFAREEWLAIALLATNLLALYALARRLILKHRDILFRAWVEHRRAEVSRRGPRRREVRPRPEAKIGDSPALQQVYNLHRFAMYDSALKRYRAALQSAPDELNTYLVGIRIVSEMEEPHGPFVQFLASGLASLRERRPEIWREVARYGQEKAPSLGRWNAVS